MMGNDTQSFAVSVPDWFTRLHGITAVGALATVIGSFLPWATVEIFGASISRPGTDGDGKLTLILGIAAIAALGVKKYGVSIAALVMLLSSGITVYDVFNMSRRAGDVNGMSSAVHVSVGIGLWLAAAGSLAALFASAALARDQQRNP